MDDDYLEAVLDVVDRIPRGKVMTYGSVAEAVSAQLEARGERPRGGARQVGNVLSRAGGGVPWWRVVNAAGSPPTAHLQRALTALAADGAPLVAYGLRVDLREAAWWPEELTDDGAVADAAAGT